MSFAQHFIMRFLCITVFESQSFFFCVFTNIFVFFVLTTSSYAKTFVCLASEVVLIYLLWIRCWQLGKFSIQTQMRTWSCLIWHLLLELLPIWEHLENWPLYKAIELVGYSTYHPHAPYQLIFWKYLIF